MELNRCDIIKIHSKTPIPSVPYKPQWLDRDGVVTDDNSLQHSDYTVDQLWVVTLLPAINSGDYTVSA